MLQKSSTPTFLKLCDTFDPSVPAVAIDFETYYDDNCSVSRQSYWAYTHHENFDAYLVSMYGPGIHYVGHPKDAPWKTLSGMIWLSHNRPFDESVYMRLVETGVAPLVSSHAWCDTADLARYMKYPASLGKAAPAMIGRDLDKGVRDDMKGVRFDTLDDATRERWIKYADVDAIACWEIWDRYHKCWPRDEMLLSMHTAECVKRGVRVDVSRLEEALEVLPKALAKVESRIPWAGEPLLTPSGKQRTRLGQPQTKSPTSTTWLGRWLEKEGVEAPSSTDTKDPGWHQWLSKYRGTDAHQLIESIQQWRKVNRTLRVCEQIRDRIRSDGRMEFQLMYFGARNTGRWSGKRSEWEDDSNSTNLNMLNLPKDHLYLDSDYNVVEKGDIDIYIRSLFIPGRGKHFIVSDLAQIEPRVLGSIVEDEPFLEWMRKGTDPYEAYARTHLGYKDERPLKVVDPALRQQAKVAVLQLGYQSGAPKLRDTAEAIYGMDMTISEAEKMVAQYRASNTKVVDFWRECQVMIQRAAAVSELRTGTLVDILAQPPSMEVELDSGRKLSYFNLRRRGREFSCASFRGGKVEKIYGGKLTENCVQAQSRDVFADCILRIEMAGLEVIWHIYDEVVVEAHRSVDPSEIEALMSVSPEWCSRLPVAAEAVSVDAYQK